HALCSLLRLPYSPRWRCRFRWPRSTPATNLLIWVRSADLQVSSHPQAADPKTQQEPLPVAEWSSGQRKPPPPIPSPQTAATALPATPFGGRTGCSQISAHFRGSTATSAALPPGLMTADGLPEPQIQVESIR